MKLVMPSDLALMQRIAGDLRIGKKRCAQRTLAETHNAPPRSAQVQRIEHRVRKHHGYIAATQEHFAHEHASAAAVCEEETFVAVRAPQTLEN